jgi:hypothetical protein
MYDFQAGRKNDFQLPGEDIYLEKKGSEPPDYDGFPRCPNGSLELNL